MQGILREWTQDEVAQVAEQDMNAMEQSVQALLRLVGGRLMGTLVEASVAQREKTPPSCPRCERPMRLVDQRRKRDMRGLVGDFGVARPYYQCRACGGGLAPDDERLGIGVVGYTPALSRVAALTVTEVPFERAARDMSETLGAVFAEADIYRVVEALGVVAEAEIQAGMAAPQADPVAPAGDTLLIGVDGTTSFIDGDWHEVKVGVVGVFGPELRHVAGTGRDLLGVSDPRYCTAVATVADEFFLRVALLARQAGFGHQDLRRIVCLGDGGRWICWHAHLQPERRDVHRDPGLHARERTRLARGRCLLR